MEMNSNQNNRNRDRHIQSQCTFLAISQVRQLLLSQTGEEPFDLSGPSGTGTGRGSAEIVFPSSLATTHLRRWVIRAAPPRRVVARDNDP